MAKRTTTAFVASLLVLPLQVQGAESREAREKARECEILVEPAAAAVACRAALSMGLGPSRASSVRQLLGRRLVVLSAWAELAALYSEEVAAEPTDAARRSRLGAVLLFSLERADEALLEFAEAVRLRPEVAAYRIDLGLALAAVGRRNEALAAFAEAVRLDESAFSLRPAAAAIREALGKSMTWPQTP